MWAMSGRASALLILLLLAVAYLPLTHSKSFVSDADKISWRYDDLGFLFSKRCVPPPNEFDFSSASNPFNLYLMCYVAGHWIERMHEKCFTMDLMHTWSMRSPGTS
jgi:hypothetical protein